MPLDFPSSPTNGQVYGNYYYNSARGAWNALLPAATPNFFTNAQLIDATASSSASSTTPLVVIGSSGQSVDLQQWKDSAGTILSDISSQGALMTQYVEIRNIVGSGLVNGESQFKVISPDNTKDIRFWNRNDAGGIYYYNSAGGSANVLRITHSTTPRLVTQLIQDFTSGNSADFGARVNVSTVAAANIGLVVRASASQTADLQQWQSSTGAVLSDINANGELQVPRIGVGSVMPTTTHLYVTAAAASNIPIVVQGAASQSANLQEWKDNAGTNLVEVQQNGDVVFGGTGSVSDTRTLTINSLGYAGININGDTGNNPSAETGGAFVKLSQDGDIITGVLSMIQGGNGSGINASQTYTGTAGNSMLLGTFNSSSPLHFGTAQVVRMTIDGSGRIVTPAQPSFRAYSSSSGGKTGTLTYNITEHNIGNHFDQSTGRFTVPVAGRYLISFHAFRETGQSGNWVVNFHVNGVYRNSRAYDDSDTSTGYGPNTTLVDVLSLSANDYVTVVVSAGSVHANDNCFFSGHLLG